MCAEFNIVTPATVVDHIIEISDGGKADDINNLQSLCRACHNRKTAKEAVKRRKKRQQKGYQSMSDF